MNWERVAALLMAVWVGGLVVVGYWMLPALWGALFDQPRVAGVLSRELMLSFCFLSELIGVLLLVVLALLLSTSAFVRPVLWLLLLMVSLNSLECFATYAFVANIRQTLGVEYANNIISSFFSSWHGASSILYWMQTLLGMVVIWRWHADVSAIKALTSQAAYKRRAR